MNEKEVAEIRRRFRPDRANITRIRGCYVNDQKEIVSELSQPLVSLPPEEAEELLGLMKKTLSGTLGKNLLDIEFETRQVTEGEEHKLLMRLRSSGLEDDEAVRAFCEKVIAAVPAQGSYLILLACDKYDVPSFSKDGGRAEDSETMFSYFVCALCPVKLTKPALGYLASENRFCNLSVNAVVAPPELGFLFPAFDDRAANIYNALYYTRSTSENHPEFVDAVFKREVPMPAEAQKETFAEALGETVGDACSFEVVRAVREQLSEKIEEHKENKEEEPPAVSKQELGRTLRGCGVPEERVAAFEERYDSEFGAETAVSPQVLVDKRLELSTPDVTIRVSPDRGDLIETRVIDGVRYLMIRADEGVEVNGVPIHIA